MVKTLRPNNLIFNLRQFLENEKAVNFMKQLTSYTGRKIKYVPVIEQQKLDFGKKRCSPAMSEISEEKPSAYLTVGQLSRQSLIPGQIMDPKDLDKIRQ